jgi:hypothetical protein
MLRCNSNQLEEDNVLDSVESDMSVVTANSMTHVGRYLFLVVSTGCLLKSDSVLMQRVTICSRDNTYMCRSKITPERTYPEKENRNRRKQQSRRDS